MRNVSSLSQEQEYAQEPGHAWHGQQKTRDRFLDGALEVFAKNGYHAATVQDILDASGGGRATFYTYFSSKADVAACLFERLLPGTHAAYVRLASCPVLTRQVVREWLEEGLLFWRSNRIALEAMNHAMADDPDVGRRHYAYIVQAIEALAQAWEGPYHAEGQLRATVVVLQWERLCWHWLVQGVPLDRDLVLDVVSETWLAQLQVIRKGPPSGARAGGRS